MDGLGVLHRMIVLQNLETVKMLLNPPENSCTKKADVNLKCKSDKEWTPLVYAVHTSINFDPAIAELIEAGADTDFMDKDGYAVIHYTVLNGNYKFLQRILIAGADVSKTCLNP
jgi:ankyrin repeat protein